MNLKTAIFFFVLIFGLQNSLTAQKKFQTVRGSKADYTLDIPSGYSAEESIGLNIDLKYADKEGASIITTVKKLPRGVTDEQVVDLNNMTDKQIVNQLESLGMENITIIKKGFLQINSMNSYFLYYTDGNLYHHTLTQFKEGNIFNLTITCEYSKKSIYMPYIFRVINSLKHY